MSIIIMNAHKNPGLVVVSYSLWIVEEGEERLFAQIHAASSGEAKLNTVCSRGPCQCTLPHLPPFPLCCKTCPCAHMMVNDVRENIKCETPEIFYRKEQESGLFPLFFGSSSFVLAMFMVTGPMHLGAMSWPWEWRPSLWCGHLSSR